jgi:hypothetical protein
MQNARGLRVPQRCALALVAVASLAASMAHAVAPRISGTPSTTATVGQNYSFRPTASDADGNALTFSITNKPGWASFSASTGQMSGVPFAEHAKTYSNIIISVTDGTTRVSLPAFSLVVRPNPNGSPQLSGTPPTTATVGTAYSFQPTARDPEGRTLTFSIRNRPAWATFSTSTGRLSGTPTAAGTFSGIMIIATDGVSSASLPHFTITVSGSSSGGGNTAPTISGTPPTTGRVGTAYSFTPTARDANNDRLTFSIVNRPAWATFDTATGRLAGTPNVAGILSNITIRVTDGQATASLSPFSIAVATATGTVRTASLSWTPPTRNTDGTTLTNLAGYRIAYGTNSSSLSQTVTLSNPGLTSYVVDNLSTGTWYFSIRAYTSGGTESATSPVVSKIIQ